MQANFLHEERMDDIFAAVLYGVRCHPDTGTERSDFYGRLSRHIRCFCRGRYCVPLYLQMVGWRQIVEAASLGHKPPCTNGKKATESPILRGFRLLWAILVTFSLSALYHKQRQNQGLREALINLAQPSWRIFFARLSLANPPHSLCYASGLLPQSDKKSTPIWHTSFYQRFLSVRDVPSVPRPHG